jgi:hypothetical protein
MKLREAIYYFTSRFYEFIINLRKTLSSSGEKKSEQSQNPSISVSQWMKKVWLPIYLVAMTLLFGINALWAYFDGILFSDQNPLKYNFLEDWPNVINYILICPIYITLGICFLYFFWRLRTQMNENGTFPSLGIEIKKPSMTTIIIWSGIGMAACFTSISFYAGELNKYHYQFWFHTVTQKGEYVLSSHGYYYLVSNIILNILTVAVVIAHLELFYVAIRVGKAIKQKLDEDIPLDSFWYDKNGLLDKFSFFSALYIISKLLVLTYLINIYTWKAQDPQFIGMLDLSILLIAVLGAAVVSYPRYHIQYWIFKAWNKKGLNLYPDIRKPLQVGLANMADFLILGGAMTNLIAYLLHHSNIKFTM